MRLRILTLSLVLFSVPALAQSTWYVDASATPPGDGSPTTPYVSIQAALASPTTHTGDTVLVAPGTYAGNVTVQSTGVFLRSTAGPSVTSIAGFVLADGIHAGSGPAVVEGFTISSTSGTALSGATLRRCIVRNPGPVAAGSRGVFFDDASVIESCVVTGYQNGFLMFAFATQPAEIRNTIAVGNTSVISFAGSAHFQNCAFDTQPVANDITVVDSFVGDPGFWDAAHADFHLAPDSPCIDAGLGSDPDGSVADIGAIPAGVPVGYCTATPTSDGCFATVTTSGTCSATSASPFLVTASGVPPNKTGRLLYSFGDANVPFQGGTLCLALPLTRTPAMSSGSEPPPFDACSGAYAFDFNARVQSGVDPLLVPGRVVYAQYRFRDPFAASGLGVGWSDAARFGIAP